MADWLADWIFLSYELIGHYKKSGVTPCGLDRDICLKCENRNLTESQCNRVCNTIHEKKDSFGCILQVNLLGFRKNDFNFSPMRYVTNKFLHVRFKLLCFSSTACPSHVKYRFLIANSVNKLWLRPTPVVVLWPNAKPNAPRRTGKHVLKCRLDIIRKIFLTFIGKVWEWFR